jgi:hypothetical protein
VSIQFIITILRDAEVDARKAHHLAHYINQNGGGAEQIDALETYARNALVSINHAERLAVAIRDQAEKEEESK